MVKNGGIDISGDGKGDLNMEFKKPDFSKRGLELRFEDGVVCIYATPEGLKRFISYCNELLDKQSKEHIHLEDYEILTNKSLKGTVALFEQ